VAESTRPGADRLTVILARLSYARLSTPVQRVVLATAVIVFLVTGVAALQRLEIAFEGGQARLAEDLVHEPHVLRHDDPSAVGDRDPGGLLAAVLEREQAVVGEPRDILARGEDAEDAALVLRTFGHERVRLGVLRLEQREGSARHRTPDGTVGASVRRIGAALMEEAAGRSGRLRT
jgi:hypothetical protein